jgi:hypothetical protein
MMRIWKAMPRTANRIHDLSDAVNAGLRFGAIYADPPDHQADVRDEERRRLFRQLYLQQGEPRVRGHLLPPGARCVDQQLGTRPHAALRRGQQRLADPGDDRAHRPVSLADHLAEPASAGTVLSAERGALLVEPKRCDHVHAQSIYGMMGQRSHEFDNGASLPGRRRRATLGRSRRR